MSREKETKRWSIVVHEKNGTKEAERALFQVVDLEHGHPHKSDGSIDVPMSNADIKVQFLRLQNGSCDVTLTIEPTVLTRGVKDLDYGNLLSGLEVTELECLSEIGLCMKFAWGNASKSLEATSRRQGFVELRQNDFPGLRLARNEGDLRSFVVFFDPAKDAHPHIELVAREPRHKG